MIIAVPPAFFIYGFGFRLADHFSGRKLGGIVEGDWFALVGLVGAVAVIWLAHRVADLRVRKP